MSVAGFGIAKSGAREKHEDKLLFLDSIVLGCFGKVNPSLPAKGSEQHPALTHCSALCRVFKPVLVDLGGGKL